MPATCHCRQWQMRLSIRSLAADPAVDFACADCWSSGLAGTYQSFDSDSCLTCPEGASCTTTGSAFAEAVRVSCACAEGDSAAVGQSDNRHFANGSGLL